MPRARSKQELIDFGTNEFELLLENAQKFTDEGEVESVAFENRRVKDIYSHLVAWHQLMLGWYDIGMDGGTPEIPAPGLSFKDTPELNEQLFQKYKDMDWQKILSLLSTGHQDLMTKVKKHSEEELFTKKYYPWTGTTSLGSYFASATSSHYHWANQLFKKLLKSKK